MKLTVSTTPVPVDTSALKTEYPEREGIGQVTVVQNLGPGDLFLDFKANPLNGLKVTSGGAYEFPVANSQAGLVLVATEASDVRIVVMG